MSKQNMIPCSSGKCGVQSHIVGSAEQKACAAGSGASEASFNPVTPAILGEVNKFIALGVFRDDNRKQVEAAKKRDLTIAGTPTGSGVSDWVFRLRNNPSKRRELADQEYAEGRWDEKVKQSFSNILEDARKARPSIEGGESVKPLKIPGSYNSYSDIKYMKDRDNIHIYATEQDGSESTFRYGSNEIMFSNEFPERSVAMRSSGYLNKEHAVYRTRGNPTDHEQAKDLIELLVHCQNEKNWQ